MIEYMHVSFYFLISFQADSVKSETETTVVQKVPLPSGGVKSSLSTAAGLGGAFLKAGRGSGGTSSTTSSPVKPSSESGWCLQVTIYIYKYIYIYIYFLVKRSFALASE